jgi:3D-(3,5/4)-trihydroxycyclohexane-1,2-dione acylhydrolase (decyclizing)
VRLTIVLLDNRGFGCIERLQRSVGSASFNNLRLAGSAGQVDFVAHARSLGALAVRVAGIGELASALATARGAPHTSVIVIETDPALATTAGGCWWDVPVPEVSERGEVKAARERYSEHLRTRRE